MHSSKISKKSIVAAGAIGALAAFTDTQLFIIGLVTTAIVQVIRWIYAAIGQKKLSKKWTLVGVFLVCFGLFKGFNYLKIHKNMDLARTAFDNVMDKIRRAP